MSLIITAAFAAMLTQQQPVTVEPRLLRYPAIHGDTVVFTYAGDLWVAKTSGGLARHLTSGAGQEIRPHFSKDGKTIAFTGMYDGPRNIYTIPVDGGEPKRLTYDSESDVCLDWTPDGNIAYATTAGSFTFRQQRMWLVSPNGGLPKSTPIEEVSEVSFFPDGKSIAYNRFPSAGFNWRHYRGGTEGKISFYDFATGAYKEIPSNREQSYYPMVVGRSVYYISDRGTGVLNLFRHDMDSNREKQLTDFHDADIRTPSTDGKTIVFERNGYLCLYDIASGQISQPTIQVAGEDLAARPAMRQIGAQITGISLSPSGIRVAVDARGHLFNVPAKTGDTHLLTTKVGIREQHPRWSPDGKSIAYLSDESGNAEIYVRPEMGGDGAKLTSGPKAAIDDFDWSPDSKSLILTRHDNTLSILDAGSAKETKIASVPFGVGSADWSPDSKWIAYTPNERNGHGSLWLYSVDTGKATQVDSGYYNNGFVQFDLNGRFLYMTSDRVFATRTLTAIETPDAYAETRLYVIPLSKETRNPLEPRDQEEPAGNPEPRGGGPRGPGEAPSVHIDLDHLSDRIFALPTPAGAYDSLAHARNGVYYTSGGALFRFDLVSREATAVFVGLPPGLTTSMNAGGTRLAYYGAGVLGVIELHPGPPSSFGEGRVDTSAVAATIDPRAEWKQIFWEAWRFERDHFYDRKMRGLDWPKVGQHYADFLPYVNSRDDLNYVIGLMIGELGTGHAYVSGGDMGPARPGAPAGCLGADFSIEDGHVRIKKIYRGHSYSPEDRSPLGQPGVDVHNGDYLIAIDGVPVTPDTNPAQMLLGTANRVITISVNSTPTDAGARTVRVRPVLTELALRYDDFVDSRLAMVDKLSGGRIGYVQVRDTGAQGAEDLARGFFAQTAKDALIVDERWNSGGNLPTGFVELLKRTSNHGVFVRDAGVQTDTASVDGPKAMLINGYAGSGGDAFPWLFRHAKVGPLIGKRTWGGLVGYNGADIFVDGGEITSPEAAMYDLNTGEIIAENTGVAPDIDVDFRPDLVAKGEDPPLEAAVKYLLDALAKLPPRKAPPVVPTVNKLGRIGG